MTTPRYKLGSDNTNQLFRDITDNNQTVIKNDNIDIVKMSGITTVNVMDILHYNPVINIHGIDTSVTTAHSAIILGTSGGSNDWTISTGNIGLSVTDPEYNFHISKNGNEHLTILDNGLIGISESRPLYNLDVGGNTRTQGDLFISGNVFIEGVTGYADVDNIWYVNSTNNDVLSTFPGNYGIGISTPQFKLDVSGDINFSGTLFQNGVTFSSGGTGTSNWTTQGGNIYNNNLNGNVGIGITNPIYELDVSGDINTNGVYRINTTEVLNTTTLGSSVIISSLTSVGTLGNLTVSGDTTLTTMNTTGLSQLNSLGVTTNTTITGTMDVIGDTTLTTMNTTGLSQLNSLGVTTNALILGTMDIMGDVGIGTTNPTYKLDVVGTGVASIVASFMGDTGGNGGRIAIGDSGARMHLGYLSTDPDPINNIGAVQILQSNNGDFVLSTRTNIPSDMIFYTSGSTFAVERMRIKDSGYIGINTNNPTSLLTIDGNIQMKGQHIISGIDPTDSRPALNTTPIGDYELRASGTNGLGSNGGFMRLSAGGGGSTTNQTYIDMSGFSSNGDMDDTIVFGTRGVERMRINNSGDFAVNTNTLYVDTTAIEVGINTASPSFKLDVNGTFRCSNIFRRDLGMNVNGVVYYSIRKITRDYFENFGTSSTRAYTTVVGSRYKFDISGSFDSTGGVASALIQYVDISTGPTDPEVIIDQETLKAGNYTAGDPGTFPTLSLEGIEVGTGATGGGRIRITLTNCTCDGNSNFITTQYQII